MSHFIKIYLNSIPQKILNIIKSKVDNNYETHAVFIRYFLANVFCTNIIAIIIVLNVGACACAFSFSEEWKEELVKHKDWFLSQNSVVCDESKRTKKPSVKVNMLAGVEGSFRKLEVD